MLNNGIFLFLLKAKAGINKGQIPVMAKPVIFKGIFC